MPTSLNALLKSVVERGGTDLHVTTNSLAAGPDRRRAEVRSSDAAAHRRPRPSSSLYSILTDNQKHRLEENLEIDFSFGIKGLARFRANVFHQRGAHRRGVPADPLRDPRLPRARPAAGGRAAVREAARPGAGDRPHRLGQVDDAGGDDRQDQPRAHGAHRHHRGSGRVPAQPQEVHRQPARDARRHPQLRQRPALGAAPGPRRRADRRDARPRDRRVGAAHRRDRPPDLRHPAHQLGGADHQPHHRHLPAAPAGTDPRAALVRARGHPLPVAAAARRAARGARWRWRS